MTKTTHRLSLTALAAFSALAAASAVQAQSVTLYGVIDTGIETVSNTAAGGTITRVPSNTGIFASRWGMRGREDLGGGLAAVFTLESGFAPDTGAMGQGGRLFGRQALVGLSGDWGAVTLGRQYSMLFWSMLDADIVGPSVFGLGSLDAYIPNARHDNAIVYRGKFNALSVGASYSLGRDTVNAGPSPVGTNCPGESGSDSKACRAWSLMAKYDTPGWGAAVAYDRQHGRTLGAAPDAVFGGLNSSAKTDARLNLNGYVKLGDAKLAAGVIRRDNDGSATRPKSSQWYVGASYAINPTWTVDGTVTRLSYKNVDNADSTLVAMRALYKMSKRTTVYGQLGHISNQSAVAVSVSGGATGSNPLAGGSQTGTMFGINHSF